MSTAEGSESRIEPASGGGDAVSLAKENDAVRLVTSWCSPMAHRVAITLRQKRIRHVLIEENLLNTNKKTLLANPLNKRVPILIHRRRLISESLIIMEYIEESWSTSPVSLLPSDPFERSAARYWSNYVQGKITDMILRHIGESTKEVADEVVDALVGLNKAMMSISPDGSFFMGHDLSFVDIVFAPMLPWLQALEILDGFQIPDDGDCPRLHKWFKALEAHPNVTPSLQASTPEKLVDLIVTHFRKPGSES